MTLHIWSPLFSSELEWSLHSLFMLGMWIKLANSMGRINNYGHADTPTLFYHPAWTASISTAKQITSNAFQMLLVVWITRREGPWTENGLHQWELSSLIWFSSLASGSQDSFCLEAAKQDVSVWPCLGRHEVSQNPRILVVVVVDRLQWNFGSASHPPPAPPLLLSPKWAIQWTCLKTFKFAKTWEELQNSRNAITWVCFLCGWKGATWIFAFCDNSGAPVVAEKWRTKKVWNCPGTAGWLRGLFCLHANSEDRRPSDTVSDMEYLQISTFTIFILWSYDDHRWNLWSGIWNEKEQSQHPDFQWNLES